MVHTGISACCAGICCAYSMEYAFHITAEKEINRMFVVIEACRGSVHVRIHSTHQAQLTPKGMEHLWGPQKLPQPYAQMYDERLYWAIARASGTSKEEWRLYLHFIVQDMIKVGWIRGLERHDTEACFPSHHPLILQLLATIRAIKFLQYEPLPSGLNVVELCNQLITFGCECAQSARSAGAEKV